MKKIMMIVAIVVLVCSGVIGITISVNVGSFKEAWNKIVEWHDETLYPLYERGVDIND